eukprot:526729-Prymnesium_polylepis.1
MAGATIWRPSSGPTTTSGRSLAGAVPSSTPSCPRPSSALWRATSPPHPPTSPARPTTQRSTTASRASKWLGPSWASPLRALMLFSPGLSFD